MSALGASAQGPSDYQRSKAAGEQHVRDESGVTAYTILRPSVIFGRGDAFLNLFAKLVRVFPVLPLARPKARFQPIWVEDVARCFAIALGNPACFSQAYDLGGPRSYTLEELVQYVAGLSGRKPRIVGLPDSLAKLQAWTFEHLPGKIMTRDNLRSMSVDNVVAGPFPAVFGFEPSPIESVVPEYLAADMARARYARYRAAR
jgi:NADH dehydrogenase